MYNWIDDRNFSGSKNLQELNFIPKICNTLTKNRFEPSVLNRLPVIKEEEGNPHDDEPAPQQNPPQREPEKNFQTKIGTYMKDSDNEVKNKRRVIDTKSITRLPLLGSVNCFFDSNTRQAQDAVEIKFGKYLMSGKSYEEELGLSEIKVYSNPVKKCSEKCGECLPSKFLQRRNPVQEQNVRNDIGHVGDVKEMKRKKSKKLNMKDPNLKNLYNQEKAQSKKSLDASLSVTSFAKSQQFQTEGMQSFINAHSREINPKNSNDSFLNVENLYKQKKHHEAEKEICLLCKKVFYNSQKFVQHLLTHEAVDRISCKKCKMHFISLRKYKEHCKDVHLTSDNRKNQNLDCVKKWFQKFECRRCRLIFDSEQNYDAHRRMHIKKDLAEEYFRPNDN